MLRPVPCGDIGLAHQLIELPRQHPDPLFVPKRKISLTEVQDCHERPENRQGGTPEPAGIEKKDAQRRIERVMKLPEVRQLFIANIDGQSPVISGAGDHCFNLIERHGNLEIRHLLTHQIESVAAGCDNLICISLQVGGVFPSEHLFGLEDVGKSRGHMPNLVASCFAMPLKNLLIDWSAGRVRDLH